MRPWVPNLNVFIPVEGSPSIDGEVWLLFTALFPDSRTR